MQLKMKNGGMLAWNQEDVLYMHITPSVGDMRRELCLAFKLTVGQGFVETWYVLDTFEDDEVERLMGAVS